MRDSDQTRPKRRLWLTAAGVLAAVVVFNAALAAVLERRRLAGAVAGIGTVLLALVVVFVTRRARRGNVADEPSSPDAPAGEEDRSAAPPPGQAPETTGDLTPETAPETTPDLTPETAPETAGDLTPAAAPAAAGELASETAPETTGDLTSGRASDQTEAALDALTQSLAVVFATVDHLASEVSTTRAELALAERAIEASREATSALAGHVHEMAAELAAVSELVEQTNLIALNAAIDAARARRETLAPPPLHPSPEPTP